VIHQHIWCRNHRRGKQAVSHIRLYTGIDSKGRKQRVVTSTHQIVRTDLWRLWSWTTTDWRSQRIFPFARGDLVPTETLTSGKKRRFHWRPGEQRTDSTGDAADRIEADRAGRKHAPHQAPLTLWTNQSSGCHSHSTAGMKVHKGAVTHLMLLKRGII